MASDNEIGRVVAVDTAQVTIELNRDLKALTRSSYEGASEIGRINSYVTMPVGARRVVAMLTRVVLTEENDLRADKTMVLLPSSRRLMKATMIGTIDDDAFSQGISLFPVLDTPVLMPTKRDLDAIFASKLDVLDAANPGYCIPIGRSVVFPDYEIAINPDVFFGKHAAIIGSTGSGKSCSIATVLQSILQDPKVRHTRFVILDTNGEYRAAFQKENADGSWEDSFPTHKTLYVPTDGTSTQRLTVPYWFLDSEDFVRLFRASPGVQRPVLLTALAASRELADAASGWLRIRQNLISELNRILGHCSGSDGKDAKTIRQLSDGMLEYLKTPEIAGHLANLCTTSGTVSQLQVTSCFEQIRDIARDGIRNEGVQFESYAPIDVYKRKRIEDQVQPLLRSLVQMTQVGLRSDSASADSPRYFSKMEFRHRHLESAMTSDEGNAGRARDNCSTMLMRIYRLLEDSRFEFLFGPSSADWPSIRHALASFLRDILGAAPKEHPELSPETDCPMGVLPFYDRQRIDTSRHNIVIVDLSLLASEVLENVTALIGRLIHEFLQRISDPDSGLSRGEYPVVLILEEAQTYIHQRGKEDEESISRTVFERIAREGRKFGLGLVVASQRPSEMSKTVLSQCNSFIVHRLQNPEDLRYFREIVPGIYGQLLEQLPALAPGNALVLGECTQAPALVQMRRANPIPRSKNPKFYKSWTQDELVPEFEVVCAKWEGVELDSANTSLASD